MARMARAARGCGVIRVEILVAGGGPAGSSVARLLQRLGHRVWLVDGGADPRRHHLESLSPAIWPVLESLGLRAEIEDAGLAHAVESLVSWPALEPPRAGWVVERRRLDDRLLDAARAAGVTVVRPARIRRPRRCADGGWQVAIEEADRRYLVRADHLIDAGGRRGALAGARTRVTPTLAALCGDFEDLPLPPRTVVEAGRDAWFWGAALPDGRGRAIAFVQPARAPGDGRAAQLAARLAGTRLLAAFLGGRLVRVGVTDASSWQSPLVEDDAIKIGDAACCVDPISSQGVQLALVSAIKAAAVVHALRAGGDAAAARELYHLHVTGTARLHAGLSAQHYARGGGEAFWRARARVAGASPPPVAAPPGVDDHTPLWLQPGVVRVEVPSLDGLVIERRAAVMAPTLAGPVRFVDGIELAPLMGLLRGGETTREIALRWAAHVGSSSSVKALAWSLRMGLLATTKHISSATSSAQQREHGPH